MMCEFLSIKYVPKPPCSSAQLSPPPDFNFHSSLTLLSSVLSPPCILISPESSWTPYKKKLFYDTLTLSKETGWLFMPWADKYSQNFVGLYCLLVVRCETLPGAWIVTAPGELISINSSSKSILFACCDHMKCINCWINQCDPKDSLA